MFRPRPSPHHSPFPAGCSSPETSCAPSSGVDATDRPTEPAADVVRRPSGVVDARHVASFARSAVPHCGQGVVAILLDDACWPLGSFVVDGAAGPEAVLRAGDLATRVVTGAPGVARVVLADVRTAAEPGVDAADLDALLELAAQFSELGVELLDVLVVADAAWVSVAAATGLPPRW